MYPLSDNKIHHRTPMSGFSLIEVLVSLSIFAVVMTIAIGSLMVLISANSKAQNTQAIMTNVSYALDSMTREIRMGSDYYCSSGALPSDGEATQDCSTGGDSLAFNEGGQSLTENASSRRIGYRLANGAVERRLGSGAWQVVTPPEITMTDLEFYVTGSDRGSTGDSESPTVTLFMAGEAGEDDGTQSQFNVQTTVVQQLLDI
jgi:prepilin-type N-terminal cleavage/methylation domain-containing protein